MNDKTRVWIIPIIMGLFITHIIIFAIGFEEGYKDGLPVTLNQTAIIEEPDPEPDPEFSVVLIKDHVLKLEAPYVRLVRNKATQWKERTKVYTCGGRLVAEFNGYVDYVIMTLEQYEERGSY